MTQQMLICRNNQVCLHGIFAYENINVMTFKFIFGHYVNKRFVERIPQVWSMSCHIFNKKIIFHINPCNVNIGYPIYGIPVLIKCK